MAEIRTYNPDGLQTPAAPYCHVARVKASEFIFIAGQVAGDKSGKIVGADDFEAQCVQVFSNLETALKSAGAGWGNVVQFTTYLVHSQDIARLAQFRRREFPRFFPSGAYPPNTLLVIDRLAQEAMLLEVQAIAAL